MVGVVFICVRSLDRLVAVQGREGVGDLVSGFLALAMLRHRMFDRAAEGSVSS